MKIAIDSGRVIRGVVCFALLNSLHLFGDLIQNLYAGILVELLSESLLLLVRDGNAAVVGEHEEVHEGFSGRCDIGVF